MLQDTAQVRLASAELVVAGYPDVVVQGVERGDLGRAVINGGGEGAAREVAAVDEEDVAVRRTFAGDVRREASEVKVGVNVRRLDYGQRVGRRLHRERGQNGEGQKFLFHCELPKAVVVPACMNYLLRLSPRRWRAPLISFLAYRLA